jgi:NADPH:quinone reductase-like Zn-dependent oxidoreductase
MKAIVQLKYGSPDDLEVRDVEKPLAGDGEVLVRVCAASLHPDVWHVVAGHPWVLRFFGAGFLRPRNPIPGTDMAGVVESVGKGVTGFRPGDAVFGETRPTHQWTHGGTYAEYVVAQPEWLALKPANVTFAQAAAVPSSGFIALLNLRGGRVLRPGQRVLVNGAGGGVGAIALQLAKARGAHVTGVDRAGKLDSGGVRHLVAAESWVRAAGAGVASRDVRPGAGSERTPTRGPGRTVGCRRSLRTAAYGSSLVVRLSRAA